MSAHRTPVQMGSMHRVPDYGLKVIIAGAEAAHLPGMVATLTSLLIIGVPIKSKIH